jgi:hypothetical protein
MPQHPAQAQQESAAQAARSTASVLPPRWLTRQQAARYVGVSARTFNDEVKAGTWPAGVPRGLSRTKRSLRWDRAALDATSDRMAKLSPTGAPTLEEAADEWAKSQ